MKFTNYEEHPRNPNYTVFSFKTREEARYFEGLLDENKIWFEKDESGVDGNPEYTLYAVKRKDLKLATRQNFLTSAKFRKPFLAEPAFRYVVVGLSLLLVGLAIAGYVSTKGESTAVELEKVEDQ